ncbi:hypothetical protein A6X21_04900 [Planctopirus hydrillae]|uniref:Uncharacterized protein n=1 Tax=Planctopirus hydrillae TaxID=1841610 RepID=A0A1C3EP35_9PLAN|nr:hypothetical protein A6X21_04900 [Planctopirus hydrillae]
MKTPQERHRLVTQNLLNTQIDQSACFSMAFKTHGSMPPGVKIPQVQRCRSLKQCSPIVLAVELASMQISDCNSMPILQLQLAYHNRPGISDGWITG